MRSRRIMPAEVPGVTGTGHAHPGNAMVERLKTPSLAAEDTAACCPAHGLSVTDNPCRHPLIQWTTGRGERLVMSYTLRTNYHEQPAYRDAYFRFTAHAFAGTSFAAWYAKGGWNAHYQVFSLFDGADIVANVSVSTLTLLLDGHRATGVQFSAVGTLPAYRRQGLARRLMTHVLDHFAASTDLFFLFANASVLDFYPKFGFRLVQDYEFLAAMPKRSSQPVARPLDPHNAEDWRLLTQYAQHRLPVSQVWSATDYGHVLLYHALAKPHTLWYLEPLDTVMVCAVQNDVLDLYDIVSPRVWDIHAVLRGLPFPSVQWIRVHFTPDLLGLPTQALAREQRTLPFFVRGTFPLHQPCRFPAMGET
jgi:GNAT superfamily N-acetyltransferase